MPSPVEGRTVQTLTPETCPPLSLLIQPDFLFSVAATGIDLRVVEVGPLVGLLFLATLVHRLLMNRTSCLRARVLG